MELLLTKQMVKNWLLIISLFFFGCTQNQVYQDLIPREKFKKILIDIDNYHTNLTPNQTTQDSMSVLKNVLHQHGVSDTIYQKTLLFYIKNPQDMLSLIKEVEVYLDD